MRYPDTTQVQTLIAGQVRCKFVRTRLGVSKAGRQMATRESANCATRPGLRCTGSRGRGPGGNAEMQRQLRHSDVCRLSVNWGVVRRPRSAMHRRQLRHLTGDARSEERHTAFCLPVVSRRAGTSRSDPLSLQRPGTARCRRRRSKSRGCRPVSAEPRTGNIRWVLFLSVRRVLKGS